MPDIDLTPGGVDAHPEPWEVAVPEQGILVGNAEGADRALGDAQSLRVMGQAVSRTKDVRVLSDRRRIGPASWAPPSLRERTVPESVAVDGRRKSVINPQTASIKSGRIGTKS